MKQTSASPVVSPSSCCGLIDTTDGASIGGIAAVFDDCSPGSLIAGRPCVLLCELTVIPRLPRNPRFPRSPLVPLDPLSPRPREGCLSEDVFDTCNSSVLLSTVEAIASVCLQDMRPSE